MKDDANSAGKRGRLLTLVLLLIVGAAFRVFGAWCFKEMFNADSGVVALMAKHMAEGRGFPLFFYGQAYMGSLEPALSALICRIFGCNGFTVCLGTAFAGFLILPVVYFWTRDAAGGTAALAATLFCIIGPGGYFHYMASPRGGYAIVLLAGATVLWLSSRLVCREKALGPQSGMLYFLLGFIAGLGWWSDQLILPVLLSSLLVIIAYMREKAFSRRVLAGVPGFLAGSLPFWFWNVCNNWGTFSFARSFQRPHFLEALRIVLTRQTPHLFDLHVLNTYAGFTLALLYLLVFALGAVLMFAPPEERRGRWCGAYAWNVVLYTVIFFSIYSFSHFSFTGSARYLLPLVPVFALALGVATSFLVSKWGLFGWLPLAVMMIHQAYVVLPGAFERAAAYDERMADVHAFGDYLRENEIKAVFCDYTRYARNFLLNEEFCLTSLCGEKYKPYEKRAELADNIAIEKRYGEIGNFLNYTMGEAVGQNTAWLYLFHDFQPPPGGLREIAPSEWKSAVASNGTSLLPAINDRDIDTYFCHCRARETGETITITFKKQVEAAAIRIANVNTNETYPSFFEVQGRANEDSEWETLLPMAHGDGFMWSGPRPYWFGIHYRLDMRFPVRRVKQLKLNFNPHDRFGGWLISELSVYGPGLEVPRETEMLEQLLDLLDERRILHLYSDRWVANAVYRETDGRIATELEPAIFRKERSSQPNKVVLSSATAILVSEEDAPSCRAALTRRHVNMRETRLSPWILFDFGSGQWRERYREDLGLYWAGYTCLTRHDKIWALALVSWAEEAMRDDAGGEWAIGYLEEALEAYPNLKHAAVRLKSLYSLAGDQSAADLIRQVIETRWTPKTPAHVTFDNGVRLIGLTCDTNVAPSGGALDLELFWLCPEQVENNDLAVFLHFIRDGRILFQDDHVFIENANVSAQRYPEVFLEQRRINVPASAGSGECEVCLGLYHRGGQMERVGARSNLSCRRDAVRLPVKIRIEVPGKNH